ncbi:DNA-dependent protein kinase catalytic subunit-like [Neodiprion fabricii]|uniref:DNA-dependent protein kinase catalytic subunit-like n=1 Tax=Neodiprion fabricii TaxID=2872261 RepID=UPI001ED94669|nr:DNA-dependent protein kinase catalytic subunit-like [Neodiprion fabricii]XP_046420006.1 DNA-dependent protein kinase catalytic subunit-like [Neodiprion fabricii]
MESFETFMEMFGKWRQRKDNDDLVNLFKSGPSYLQTLSTSEIGLALSELLNDKTGLLNFLADTSYKPMENAITEGFKLLKLIIQQFYLLLDRYAIGIKKVCQSAIITKCSQIIKSAAVDCFDYLIRMFPTHDLELSETVKVLINKFHLCSDTERAKYFKALGFIVKYNPGAISSAQSIIVFERIMNDFDKLYSRSEKGSQPRDLAIYLDVLQNLLRDFSPHESHEISYSYYKKLYRYLKELSEIDRNQTLKFVSRAGIAVLGSHMSLFDDFIYEDIFFWHQTLLNWTRFHDENAIVAFNALSTFYERIGIMLQSRNTESSRTLFEYFMQHFEKKITNENQESATLQLSIRGFGHMAGACKIYRTEKHVVDMFSLIAQRTSVIYTKYDNSTGSLENIAYYQVALSEILLQMSDVSLDQMAALSFVSLVFVKYFPDLPSTKHLLAVDSLMKTIHNIRKVCRRSHDEFIRQLVYEGIIWSCSHSLYVDAEREREVKNMNERPVCYKNYLPLWQQLIRKNKITDDTEAFMISEQISNNMIKTCVELIRKLNLDIENINTSCEDEVFDVPVASNDTDFRVFINLVDLFVDIIEELEPVLMESQLTWFLCEIIRKSKQNPSISGFYKLTHGLLRLFNLSSDTRKEGLLNEMPKFIIQYLSDTIEKLPSFSTELQLSCFNMIFEIPAPIVETMLDQLVSAFKSAFGIGQSNFKLAQSALNTLEKWTKVVRRERMNNFLIQIVPSLEYFLQSNESAPETSQEIRFTEMKKIKNAVLTDHEETSHEFQRRILLFFGCLSSEVTSNIGTHQSFDNGTLLNNRNSLKYTLLYQDIKPEIYLDAILPRTIQLALHSIDRRTRIVACEVLHSVTIIMLGKTMQFLSSNPDLLLPVFKKICPAILRLGSDSDQVIQQLFCPLMIQLTHWYSSKIMSRSAETDYLIEILFDSLTYQTNMALSDFSGVCLAEFVKWSIKHSTDDELQTSSTNIAVVVSKMSNFAIHPSLEKRIGAAVAFNYLCRILRESDVIINIYWLELLFYFIKSTEGCNNEQILKSLKHIEKVIENKHIILNTQNSQRRQPAEFKGTSLEDAANWLLVQCGSLDHILRSKSMEILLVISKYIPGFVSIQEFVSNYVKCNGMLGLNQIILKHLRPKIETLSEETIKPLLRTLYCYVWLLHKSVIGLEFLLTDINANKDMIFNCIINFVYLINVKQEQNDESTETANQFQELQALQCETILKIFDFTTLLLNKLGTQANTGSSLHVPTFYWNEELFSVIFATIFKPNTIGFDFGNLVIMEDLQLRIQQLLSVLIVNLDDKYITQMRALITIEIHDKYRDFANITVASKTDAIITSTNYLKGLIMLHTVDKCGKLYNQPFENIDPAKKMIEIFDSLKKERYGQEVAVNVESDVKEYLELLLEYLSLRFEPRMVIALVDIVDTRTELIHENSTTVLHGEYFMSLFRTTIFRNLLKHTTKSIDTLLSDSLRAKFKVVLAILEDLLIYVKNNKKSCGEFLENLEEELVNRFPVFRDLTSDDEKNVKIINLYSVLVQFSRKPSEMCKKSNALYSWIMKQFMGYFDLQYKTQILTSFLPCITDETAHNQHEFTRCLYKIKDDYFPGNMNDLVKDSLQHSTIITSFQTLLYHLPSLKSVTFFDCVIHVTIGNVGYLWDDYSYKYLTAYFSEISVEDSQKSLIILHKYFMNTRNFQSRLDILKKLLLKCIYFCKLNAIVQFFEQTIKEMYNLILQHLPDDESDMKNLIVSKIGCYNLFEIMFATVPLQKLTSVNSKIVQNAIGKVETGKELFQQLNMNVLGIRKLKSSNPDHKELMRLLHCAAYNCSIAIVSLKCEEHFYILPFAENKSKGQLIWENIIDTNRKYQFTQDFKEIPKEHRKLINIKKQSSSNKIHSYSTVMSYNLIASTLNEDLSCYDMYHSDLKSNTTSESVGTEEMMSLTFELDDFNNHECMAPICGLITHMISKKIFNLPNDGENISMPKWMLCFHSSLSSTMVYNVKFFMVKIILNLQKVFKPYGKSFINPLLKFLILHFQTYRIMNYVIKDILIMLLDWQSITIPSGNDEKRLAQNLLELVMKNADSHQRHIYKYNIELINMIIEAWQSCLDVPESILYTSEASSRFTIRMILIFLCNKKQETLASRPEVLIYLNELLENQDEEIVLHVCNAFGLILEYFESVDENEKKGQIISNVQRSIINKSHENHNKYIKCIHAIHKFYPNIVDYCFQQLTSHFFNVDVSNKAKCLELLLAALPKFTETEIMTELGCMKFQDILKNKIETCQKVALRMVEKLLDILSPSNYLPLAQLIVPYSRNASTEQREIVMNVFIAMYKKYNDNIEDNDAVMELKALSKRILLMGLLDPNETLQNKLLQFWSQDGNIPDKCNERILQIFNMYDIHLESTYLPIVPLLMLHLVSKDPAFEKKMFEPLSSCKFEDYQVTIPRRSAYTGLVVPLFTSSFVSRISQYYSQSNPIFTRFNQSLNQSLFLRASQSLQFKQTVCGDESFSNLSGRTSNDELTDSRTDIEKIPPPSKNIKSQRFLQNTTFTNHNLRRVQITKNLHQNEMLKDEINSQQNSIKMYRKYRIGDFPDTEITHSSLIKPLQELAKNDQIVARDLTLALFCSMLKEMSVDQKQAFLQKLSPSLERILKNNQSSKPLIATVLEIVLNLDEIRMNPNLIARVSKSSGLLPLGAILLEEKIISSDSPEKTEPLSKRSKCEVQICDAENNWLQLASIYKCMNDYDIVQSIFGCEKFGKELQEASLAQAAGNWSTARIVYENAFHTNEGLVKSYCQESLFTCLAYLSDWDKINHLIEIELGGNFDALWQGRLNENWMTSWALQAQIHRMVQNDYSDGFARSLTDWVNTKDKLVQLKKSYGEETAIFYIDENPDFSENCLMYALETLRQQWQHLNPLCYEQKITNYLKLRGLSDIKTYLKGIKDKKKLAQNVQCILTVWNNNMPSKQDNLLLWDKHIAYRLHFLGLLKQQFEAEESNETNQTVEKLNNAVVKHCLNVANAAYGQCNWHFMKKYLKQSEPFQTDNNSILHKEWQCTLAMYKYLRYSDYKTTERKVKAFIDSWQVLSELDVDNCCDAKVQTDIRLHLSSLVIELQKLLMKHEPIGQILLANLRNLQYLPIVYDQENIVTQLSDYCLINMKKCYDLANAKHKAKCYLIVSMYCRSVATYSEGMLELSEEFVHSTLSAMSYGSLEASQYFPCLLSLEYSQKPNLRQIFTCISAKVETWMFLKWQAQVLSYVGTPVCSLITPILLRLAEIYPNSFIYTFRMAKKMNRCSLNHPIIDKLNQILSGNNDLELVLEALEYVVQPELYLMQHVIELKADIMKTDVNLAINNLLSTVYPTTKDPQRTLLRGDVYKVIAKFENKIKELPQKNGQELSLQIERIMKDLDEILENRIKNTLKVPLKYYSPLLCAFNGKNVEIPGQYAYDKRPTPQYHTQIVKINPEVTILTSLRKPIKISMLGNNGKNFDFLVKFGEDLRTDERIEQLFMLMNKILQADTACRQRQLSINTYLPFPLTGLLGLIQWVKKTSSLDEIINAVLTKHQTTQRQKILRSYREWMSNPHSRKYSREAVTEKFNYCKNGIDWDIFRNAFKSLSSSSEVFFALRYNFITSYATMCIAHWILGIGDRNLSNTLISYASGKALGIDFGYSFDAAVDSSVPELMPFRLTPQILGLLQPFNEHGLLKITMMNVLRALKYGKDPLLACMDIFIKEPSLNWLARQKTRDKECTDSDVTWYPKKKISIVMDKLNGVKPSKLTLVQIKERYGNTEYFNKYIDIINGTNNGLQVRVRSKKDDENLNIEEQIECLLDQATDPNILARTFYGWEPWM